MELESKRVVSFVLDGVIDSVVNPIVEEASKTHELEVFKAVKDLLEEFLGNFPLPGSRNDSFLFSPNDLNVENEEPRNWAFSEADEEIHEVSCHQMPMQNGDDEENGDDDEDGDGEENGDDEDDEEDDEGEVSHADQNNFQDTEQNCIDYLQLVPNNHGHDDNHDFTEVEFYHQDVVKSGNKPPNNGCSEGFEGQERDIDEDVGFQTVPMSKHSDVGDENISPLLVNKDSLFSTTYQSDQGYAGKKRKQEEEGSLEPEIIYHTLCGVAMPNLLNAVPRLGLSKNSKLPKLHQRVQM